MNIDNKELKTMVKKFGDLVEGDKIIGPDGEPVEITKAYDKHIPKRMFELEMADGEIIKASGNHLWYCENEIDIKNKDEYIRLAKVFFDNNELPNKLDHDEHIPLNEMIKAFGDSIDTQMLIEKVCRSLGYSSYTPVVYREGLFKTIHEEEVFNYSYNDLIDFLSTLKQAVLNEKGYFFFGEVRTTEEIANMMADGLTINIPQRSDIIDKK